MRYSKRYRVFWDTSHFGDFSNRGSVDFYSIRRARQHRDWLLETSLDTQVPVFTRVTRKSDWWKTVEDRRTTFADFCITPNDDEPPF